MKLTSGTNEVKTTETTNLQELLARWGEDDDDVSVFTLQSWSFSAGVWRDDVTGEGGCGPVSLRWSFCSKLFFI